MDSCRIERRAAQSITPVMAAAAGGTQEPGLDRLSHITSEFSKTWGGKFSDREREGEIISRIPEQVLEDQKYQNARTNSVRQNAQAKLDSAHRRLVTQMVRRQTELYKERIAKLRKAASRRQTHSHR